MMEVLFGVMARLVKWEIFKSTLYCAERALRHRLSYPSDLISHIEKKTLETDCNNFVRRMYSPLQLEGSTLLPGTFSAPKLVKKAVRQLDSELASMNQYLHTRSTAASACAGNCAKTCKRTSSGIDWIDVRARYGFTDKDLDR